MASQSADRGEQRDPRGLSSAEAASLLELHGPNLPPPEPTPTLLSRAWRQVRDPMILLLLAAGTFTAALRDVSDTVVIGLVVVFNTVTGLVQEVRADRAVAVLRDLAPARVRAWRDGALREVECADVVPGDVLSLAAGDLVPADAVACSARQLQLDESMMTGEAVPVVRDTGEELEGGTLVTRGRAVVRVTRTGGSSGIGRLATMMASTPRVRTPLQQRLADLSRALVVIVLGLVAVVVGVGLAQGRPVTDMAVLGVSLAVAAVPESLPAVVTIALALGAHRMARRSAVVRRLPAVETLGSVTVVATDKTGTVTEARMVAEALWTPTGEYGVTGRAYDVAGGQVVGRPTHGSPAEADLRRLLRDAVLCNDAELRGSGPATSVLGDPLEGALLVVAAKGGASVAAERAQWPRRDEVAFEHGSRRMTTRHSRPDGSRTVSVCKGAPETVLGLVAGDDVEPARATAHRWATSGYRVLAFVERAEDGTVPSAWRLVGLVGIDDPPREHIPRVVEALRRAGIRLLLVTGDHLGTACAVARRVGILADDGRVEDSVLARVRPEDKVEVVAGLQAQGEVVAMLGDGVNDAPALRRADIGVAAGRSGTQVAREAADLVLLDDDLSTVVAAVEEGRRIFANIRTFLLYAVSGGAAEVGVMLAGPAVGVALPLLPAQILWINLLTHGLTGVAFGAEPADPSDMTRPPRPSASLIDRRLVRLVMLAAALLVTTSLAVAPQLGHPDLQRTSVFLTLGLGQLAVAWGIRARTTTPRGVRTLELALAGSAVLLVAGTVLPPLQDLLGTRQPTPAVLGLAVGLAAVPGLVMRGVTDRARRLHLTR